MRKCHRVNLSRGDPAVVGRDVSVKKNFETGILKSFFGQFSKKFVLKYATRERDLFDSDTYARP